MKHLALLFLTIVFLTYDAQAEFNYPHASNETILLARALSKGIFELNGVPFIQPLGEVVNITSNSRFFSSAYLYKGTENLYVKVSANGMFGIVPNSKKEYTPQFPAEPLPSDLGQIVAKLSQYLELDLSNPLQPKVKSIKDTSGLIYYAFKTLMYEGIQKGTIKVPKRAPTILGSGRVSLNLPHDSIRSLLESNPIFSLLSPQLRDSIYSYLENFPEVFDLPQGANINNIIAGIPQIEFGSIFGTELLLRFIPPVDLGKNIGKFTFWGIGIRHSISQYISKPFINIALQIAYQGTNLKNKIGVTNAELTTSGNFWNANIHFSKQFGRYFEAYSGLSYEMMHINSDYTFTLPRNVQYQLGLIYLYDDKDNNDPNDDVIGLNPELGYNGDPYGPMNQNVVVSDKNFKWTIGVLGNFDPMYVYLDFNLSKINIFTFGIMYKFDIKK